MGTLSDYFESIAHKPMWDIGDRVFGRWNNIPFIGTTGSETDKVGDAGPRVTVHLDLPIILQGKLHSVIIVKPKELKRLKSMDDTEPLKLQEAGSIPVKRTKQSKAKK